MENRECVIMTKEEYRELTDRISTYEKRIKMLQNAISGMMGDKTSTDPQISRQDFLDIYNSELAKMDEYNGEDDIEDVSKVYGNDVTVHWCGLYCNCGDGAIACNHIIGGIESVEEEEDEF